MFGDQKDKKEHKNEEQHKKQAKRHQKRPNQDLKKKWLVSTQEISKEREVRVALRAASLHLSTTR